MSLVRGMCLDSSQSRDCVERMLGEPCVVLFGLAGSVLWCYPTTFCAGPSLLAPHPSAAGIVTSFGLLSSRNSHPNVVSIWYGMLFKLHHGWERQDRRTECTGA